jgi:hypothetical protein
MESIAKVITDDIIKVLKKKFNKTKLFELILIVLNIKNIVVQNIDLRFFSENRGKVRIEKKLSNNNTILIFKFVIDEEKINDIYYTII